VNSGYFKLNVTKPCTEDWADMTSTGAGRHCQLCNKDVIDFSVLNDDQIKNFFINNAGNPVCGRFRKTQLERIRINLPGYFFQKKLPAWQKYIVVFLICFGSNLFSIDITVGNSQGLYAQTPAAIMVNHTGPVPQKKHKHKKRKKYKFTGMKEISFPGDIMISGIIGPSPVHPIEEPPPICDLKQKNNKANNDSAVKETIAYTNLPVKEDRKPRNKNPFPAMEFILPAILRLRLRRGNRK
jgi:hypothetical protein